MAIVALGWKESGPRWLCPSGETSESLPAFSVNIEDSWRLVETFAPLVADWNGGDGEFFLRYLDLDDQMKCSPTARRDFESDGKWSAHFHCGLLAAREDYPPMWADDRNYCARGQTAPHAICLAVLKGWSRSVASLSPAG